jgi:SWI/SNF chromatin-remodeling complex subunit SWI1
MTATRSARARRQVGVRMTSRLTRSLTDHPPQKPPTASSSVFLIPLSQPVLTPPPPSPQPADGDQKPAAATANGTAPRPRTQPSRRKIEYVPVGREIPTAGGRDLAAIRDERAAAARRPLRDLGDWGAVDLGALALALRSRLAPELSYALTTCTLLSALRARAPTELPPLPLQHCAELVDEVLDLLEDVAFGGAPDADEDAEEDDDAPMVTHRALVRRVAEDDGDPFAGLRRPQGARDPDAGPRMRPADTVLAITNLLRNMAAHEPNQPAAAQHPRLLDLLLRLTCLKPGGRGGELAAASPVLALADLVTVRKDALHVLASVAGHVRFAAQDVRVARRAFALLAAFLADPDEALSPTQALVQIGGLPPNADARPPAAADAALDALGRLGQPDASREVLARAVRAPRLWALFAALVRRLPVADVDFNVMLKEPWLVFVEKVVMALYALAYLAPPALKRRMKRDRAVGFPAVMLRLVRRATESAHTRQWFAVCVRRAVEALRVVDGEADAFDVSDAAVPMLAFGVGYGEVAESKVERGTGLLGGHQEEVTWRIMLQVDLDDVVFTELESLARVE